MQAYRVKNTGLFMTKLLTKEDFDEFLLEEAKIVTANSFVIDGRVQKDFFEADAKLMEYRSWKELKGFCYEIIKGKRLPLSVVVTLHAPQDICDELAEESSLGVMLKALMLQVRYDGEFISLITGISINGFTMDKTAEKLWDERAWQLLLKLGIEADVAE